MADQDEIYNCDDKDLGAMLQRLFDEGHDEVVVRHPTDGLVVVTKQDFKTHLANLKKAMNMSPADRVRETARLKNLKNQKQIRFRTAMIEAPVHTVDIDDEENFGKDVDGNELDIDGMGFLPVSQYLKGMDTKENEIGCFFDEFERKPPIRICKVV